MNYLMSEQSVNGLKKLLNNHILDMAPTARRSRAVDSGGSSYDYAGPFAVTLVVKEGTKVMQFQIGSDNVSSCIFAGIGELRVDTETLPITSDGGIWLNITNEGYEFVIEKPISTYTNYVVQLCSYDIETKELVQYQYGHIYIAGRIV